MPEVRPFVAFSSETEARVLQTCKAGYLSDLCQLLDPGFICMPPDFNRLHLKTCVVLHRGAEVARSPTELAG